MYFIFWAISLNKSQVLYKDSKMITQITLYSLKRKKQTIYLEEIAF